MQTVSSGRPISPQQLLNILTNSSFKESECEGERQRIEKQKQILLQLIQEYEAQILLKRAQSEQLEHLFSARARLRLELEAVMAERRVIDKNAADQIYNLKKSPVEIRNAAQSLDELEELMDGNCKLRIRLEEMQDYSCKLQEKIHMMEKQNRVVSTGNTNSPIEGGESWFDRYGELHWRERVKITKIEEDMWANSWKYDLETSSAKLNPRKRVGLTEISSQDLMRKPLARIAREQVPRFFY